MDTKEQLIQERDALTKRAQAMAFEIAKPFEPVGNDLIDGLASRSLVQLGRHKQAIEDTIYVIGQRLQLIEITEQHMATLQKAPEAE